jgi:hypothetical protein
MTPHDRIRRVAFLCVHAICNFAAYRAGRQDNPTRRAEIFWNRANGNFLDIGLLEWSKLFADPRGTHFYLNVLSNAASVDTAMLNAAGISKLQFEAYCREVRTYRDKFVAHLDPDPVAHLPKLDIAIESTKFLLDHLHAAEDMGGTFDGIPKNATRLYRATLADAKTHYARRVA